MTNDPSSGPGRGKLSEEEISSASKAIREAFALSGLVKDGAFVCPSHHKVHGKGTLSVRDIGTWKCFSSGEGGDAISLMLRHTSLKFPDVVRALNGQDVRGFDVKIPEVLPQAKAVAAEGEMNPDLYRRILELCGDPGREAAAEYYGTWRIDERAVWALEFTAVIDHAGFRAQLTQEFGKEALIKAGLIVERERNTTWMVSPRYPVIEPHISPKGVVHGMQFRASLEHRERIATSKRYIPKFLSLAGVDAEKSLIGIGLHLLPSVRPGTIIKIVEGGKDAAAAMTLGRYAYGLPGTSGILPDHVLAYMRNWYVEVSLDGDEAGQTAGPLVLEKLREAGVPSRLKSLPAGMDVTDYLVSIREGAENS